MKTVKFAITIKTLASTYGNFIISVYSYFNILIYTPLSYTIRATEASKDLQYTRNTAAHRR